jgi:hypothetical protein
MVLGAAAAALAMPADVGGGRSGGDGNASLDLCLPKRPSDADACVHAGTSAEYYTRWARIRPPVAEVGVPQSEPSGGVDLEVPIGVLTAAALVGAGAVMMAARRHATA